jgi:hypothetical protein
MQRRGAQAGCTREHGCEQRHTLTKRRSTANRHDDVRMELEVDQDQIRLGFGEQCRGGFGFQHLRALLRACVACGRQMIPKLARLADARPAKRLFRQDGYRQTAGTRRRNAFLRSRHPHGVSGPVQPEPKLSGGAGAPEQLAGYYQDPCDRRGSTTFLPTLIRTSNGSNTPRSPQLACPAPTPIHLIMP